MKPILFVCFLSVLVIACKSSSKTNDNYRSSVETVLRNIRTVSDKKIIACIPQTEEESLTYFSFDSKEFATAFRELQSRLVEVSSQDTMALSRFLYMSQFVDGYFAEDYFIAVRKIAKSNHVFYCEVVTQCEHQKVQRLNEVTAAYCP